MSKYEVEVLKDLKDSKKRVMTNVMEQIAQREVKKKYIRWQYSMMTVILTVCIGLFIYTQLNDENQLSASEVEILDEKTIEMFIQMARVNNDSQESMNESFESILEMDAYYAYALNKGIVFHEDTVMEQAKRSQDHFNLLKKDSKFIKEIAKLNMTLDEIYEEFMKPNIIKIVAQNELLKNYYVKYEDAFPLHAGLAVKNEAMNFFSAKYAKEINYLEEKYQISEKRPVYSTQSKIGYVAAIEGDRFLVDSGSISNEAIINKQLFGVWFPIHDVKDKINVGDKVQVTYSKTSSDGLNTAANLDELVIMK